MAVVDSAAESVAGPAPEPVVGGPRAGIVQQALRFFVVGVLSAGVDFGIYTLGLHLGLWPTLAKAVSFILGTITAYLLNRRWTFNSASSGAAPAVRFGVLYTVTFFVNVGVNALFLHLLADYSWRFPVSWVLAQGVATIINFVLLRTFVFRD